MQYKHIKIRVDEEAHKAFKVAVTRIGLTMQDYLEDSIYKAIGRKRPATGKFEATD